jgi:hypothetical protein
MPIYQNALTQSPANRLAYQDRIGATPRNEYLGALADFLAQSYAPQRTQQMQGVAQFLGVPAVSQTLDRLSYGEPLTTGAGMTTRVRPEALEAAMTLAPLYRPAGMVAKGAEQATMAAGRAGEKYAEKVLPGIMERGGLPAQLVMDLTQGTRRPLDVFHGTPHKFPPTERNPLGEFDASKIGTGEGAQVYGHGLYVAEAPSVAEGYANRLGANVINIDGKPMDFNNPIHIAASIISDPNNAGLPGKQLASAIRYDPKGIVPFGAESKVEEIAKALESGNLPKFTNQKGNFYKVDLPDEQIGKMLDFDKPLGEQSDYIKNIIKEYELDYVPPTATGGRLLEEMNRAFGPATASMHLRNAGIPGIKYLDQQSRVTPNITNTRLAALFEKNGGDAEAAVDEFMRSVYNTPKKKAEMREQFLKDLQVKRTSNFVVFPGEEKSMTILERNGQPVNALQKGKR